MWCVVLRSANAEVTVSFGEKTEIDGGDGFNGVEGGGLTVEIWRRMGDDS